MDDALRNFGQVDDGDLLLMNTCYGQFKVRAKKVLYKGTDKEEVIVHKGRNHYFIVSMVMGGSSWVKGVRVIKPKDIKALYKYDPLNTALYKPYVKGNVKNL